MDSIDILLNIITVVIVFSILVFLHEGGHFLAARAFGVRVSEFMIGLPGPSVSRKWRGTRYGITAIPLGGYVRIAGMEPGPEDPLLARALQVATEEGSIELDRFADLIGTDQEHAQELADTLVSWDVAAYDTVKPPRSSDAEAPPEVTHLVAHAEPHTVADADAALDEARKGTYRALPTWKRIVVLASGVVVNLVAAVLIFASVLTISGYEIATPTLSDVTASGPAAEAGILAGDRIVSIAGVEVDSWEAVINQVGTLTPGETTSIVVDRNGMPLEADIVPQAAPDDETRAQLGIVAGREHYRPSFGESLGMAFDNVKMVTALIAGLFTPSTFKATVSQSTSIVGITAMAGQAAKAGPDVVLWLLASLSLSLGIVNALPIPPLDGGKIVFELWRGITRREVPARIQTGLSIAGLALIGVFFVYMLYADISRLAG